MTNSIIEISEVRVQLPEWRVALHLYMTIQTQVWENGCTRYRLAQNCVNLRILAGER